MAIEFKNVTKCIKKNTVIDNVSLTIEAGKITGLQGINGSGKTMMMRLIAGLIKATKGNIIINGKIIGKDIDFPESLGMMLENPAFLNSYDGFHNLKLLADINGIIGDDIIYDSLKRVGLDDAKNKKYKKYSLGMKQRLGIAAAVMESPAIILLDEPTNSLDADGVEMVKRIVNEEKSRGATIVISCHDAAILSGLSDIIYTIESGKITGCIKNGSDC